MTLIKNHNNDHVVVAFNEHPVSETTVTEQERKEKAAALLIQLLVNRNYASNPLRSIYSTKS